MNKRQFSTTSIWILDDKTDPHIDLKAADSVRNTLANLDQQTHDDFIGVRRDLDSARE